MHSRNSCCRHRFDGALHYYETYETKDGKYMTVGALEPQFYHELVRLLSDAGYQNIPEQHPEDAHAAKRRMTEIFKEKTQAEWQAIFDGTDACVAPVLSLDEAPLHPHNLARKSFALDSSGQYAPAPAPRLSRTLADPPMNQKEPDIGDNTVEVLKEIGVSETDIQSLLKAKIAHQTHRNHSKL